MSALRPNFRRARELKDDLDQLRLDYEEAYDAGEFSRAQDIKECIRETEASLWMTGVSSEYEF